VVKLGNDVSAHRVADNVRTTDAEVIKKTNDIETHFRPIGGALVRLVREPVPPRVERNHSIMKQPVRENSRRYPLLLQVNSVAVDQHDGLACSLLDVVDANACGVKETIFSRARA